MLRNLKRVFRKESLEEKIPLVILKLDAALRKLERTGENLRKEDEELFEKCIDARLRGDQIHAMMFANECAEIRKIALLVVSSKYALEQMILRLHTVTKLGSILLTVSPVVDVVRETRGRLIGIIPNVANNLNEANTILSKCLNNMGTSSVSNVKPLMYSDEAAKVLEEAKTAAEETIRVRFPKIPQTLTEQVPEEAELLSG